MPEVEIYTRQGCGYCSAARALLNKLGARYIEHDATGRPDLRVEMVRRAGRSTFPQIFIYDRHVVGCEDLHALERAGELDALLAA